jgi:hypothetical protein
MTKREMLLSIGFVRTRKHTYVNANGFTYNTKTMTLEHTKLRTMMCSILFLNELITAYNQVENKR